MLARKFVKWKGIEGMNRKRIVHFMIFLVAESIFVWLLVTGIIGRTYPMVIIYNGFVLLVSLRLLKSDFNIQIFEHSDRVLTAFFQGLLYSSLFAIVIIAGFSLFQEVAFFVVSGSLTFWNICFFLISQVLIAFSEEVLFRAYLYEVLFSIFHRTLPAILTVSFIFAYLHFLMNGNIKQFVVSFLFSLYAFYIKTKRSNNNFSILCWTHFTYNCLARFVFSI